MKNDDFYFDNDLESSSLHVEKKDIDDDYVLNTDDSTNIDTAVDEDNNEVVIDNPVDDNDKIGIDNPALDNDDNIIDNSTYNNDDNPTLDDKDDNKSDDKEINKEEMFLIEGDFLSDNIVTEKEKSAMEHNTKTLQYLVDNASYKQNIKLPKGTYYFAKGGSATRGTEDYVIKLKNEITITGNGTNRNGTILKPYAEKGTIRYGLDMFYFNDLADSYGANANYLENVYFSDFIIDGEDVRGNEYNSSGKGFMINLCRNCTWNNIVVKNTDGTGFGMDNLINGKITNCTAINNGKNADTSSEGASGFGIGIGYSEEESVYIDNCKSIGNTKFGFFFEHQGRFTKYYTAGKAKGFTVINSTASGNLYNFGGLRANDVSYINCTALSDNTGSTKFDIYFDDQSRRTNVTNFKASHIFDDVKKSDEYYTASVWAYENAIVNGIGKNKLGAGNMVKRSEAITILWRYANRPGDVLVGSLLDSESSKKANIDTGFNDVDKSSWYVSAVKWGVDEGIINGTSSDTFSPNDNVTVAQIITMLWRYAGKPRGGKKNSFTNVPIGNFYYMATNWAYNKGIISNKNVNINRECTRGEIINMIYKYDITIKT